MNDTDLIQKIISEQASPEELLLFREGLNTLPQGEYEMIIDKYLEAVSQLTQIDENKWKDKTTLE
ncbi:MAG: hypothetical protein J7497_13635, partial [Chitinophagaceae bacterium]|nr:hypothetical protein [Chitinophagaceae bacterium]